MFGQVYIYILYLIITSKYLNTRLYFVSKINLKYNILNIINIIICKLITHTFDSYILYYNNMIYI